MRITIPRAIRDQAGLAAGAEVEITLEDGIVRIRAALAEADRGKALVAHLRRHRRSGGMTTDEIMALTRGED